MRRIVRFTATIAVACALPLGCHYHDFRDYLYDGDLSRDTHGAVIYRTGAHELPLEEPVIIEHDDPS
jgi:hypothetical protein